MQIHKILNNKTPFYLQTKLPRRRRPLYRLNIADNFHEIRCKSSMYMNSFFPDELKLGIMSLGIFQTSHLLISLKVMSYLLFVQWKEVFSTYMIQ